ncbi:cell division protein FtsL [Rivibacter subsaxonicus]|uniref:Cell division protein FtsL n=1 Tax=Rivibacter subsaxonicus TaxID=457575 RepID=A0A4Q7VG11_9BURK|nr:cell division protein FtsL [Rivibacter subsaxonicus]RZT94940.1 cell division protein FtsL [Rivibacter subsaxonicus]
MTRLNAVLLVALIVSSLLLVRESYEARRLFAALDRAQAQALQIESDHERLSLEKRTQATPLRVERLAREKLAMRTATPAVTQYVALGASAPVAAWPPVAVDTPGAAERAAAGARE